MLPVNAEPRAPPPKEIGDPAKQPRRGSGRVTWGHSPVWPFSRVLSGSESAAAGRCGVEIAGLCWASS